MVTLFVPDQMQILYEDTITRCLDSCLWEGMEGKVVAMLN
jgi:hypothetical protein